MRSSIYRIIILAIIFMTVLFTHYVSQNITLTDSKRTIPTAMSIIREHNMDLDEYRNIIAADHYSDVDSVKHHLYNIYPIGTSVLIVPIVYVYGLVSNYLYGLNVYELDNTLLIIQIELFIASLIVALTSCIIFLIAKRILQNYWLSLLCTFVFAFCTSAWSTASRALWQHGPSMLMLGLVLSILLIAREKPKKVIWAGLPLAYSYLIRPSNFISVVIISFYVLMVYRAYFLRFLLTTLPVAILFFIYNLKTHGTFFTVYYLGQGQGHSSNYLKAVLGILLSPGRGLFIFSPILIFSIFGIYGKFANRNFNKLDLSLLAIIIFHILLFSYMYNWWGGWSFGPRYLTDMLPFFIYFLTASLLWISRQSLKRKVIYALFFVPLLIISFYINYRGATDPATFYNWNASPKEINEHPERLWQWNDLQFLRHSK